MYVNYSNEVILLTGATGFLGKVLLESLLFHFKPKKIYVLIRDNATNRFERLKNSPIWTRVKDFSCVIPITSDLELDGLGMSILDDTKIKDDPPKFVFHCAASIDFDASLACNVKINVNGTLALYDYIASFSKNVRFVHVSTTYVGSRFEEPCNRLTDEEIRIGLLHDKISKNWPNTYVWSKLLCEKELLKRSELHLIIVRPSIITNALAHPMPGWADSRDAAIALFLLHAHGLWHVHDIKPTHVVDIIPVDYCWIFRKRNISLRNKFD